MLLINYNQKLIFKNSLSFISYKKLNSFFNSNKINNRY